MSEPHLPPPGGPQPEQPQYGQPQYGQYQQGQPPQGQYQQGQYPPAPEGSGYYQAAPVERPPAITKAVMMMRLGAALTLLSIITVFTSRGLAAKQLKEKMPQLTGQELDQAISRGLMIGVVSAVIMAGLWWWMAVMNGKGKAWARVVATVFFAISVLQFAVGVATAATSKVGVDPINMAFQIALVVVGGAAVFFMWQRESTRYYEESSRTS